MSIPKEPRQLMINIMYIVLTAMLALNVSVEVLDAFRLLNSELDRSSAVLDNQNKILPGEIAKYAKKDWKQFEVYANRAKEVSASSQAFVDEVDDLIDELIDAAGNKDGMVDEEDYLVELDEDGNELSRRLKGERDKDTATRILLGENPKANDGKGADLEMAIHEYRELFEGYIDKADRAEVAPKLSLNIENDWENSDKSNWAHFNFYQMPLGAVLPMLTKIKYDTKSSENVVLNYLHKKVGASEAPIITKTKTISSPMRSYIIKGDQYKTDIFLGAVDMASSGIKIKVDGRELPVRNGSAQYSVTANENGIHKYTVESSIFNPVTGETDRDERTFEYEVGERFANVAATAMNVIYVGVDNPLRIAAAGIPSQSIKVTSNDMTLKKISAFEYIATATRPNKNAIISVTGEGLEKMDFVYRIKKISDPIPIIGKGPNKTGGTMGNAEFKAQLGLGTMLKNFEWEVNCSIIGYEVTRQSKRKDPISAINGRGRYSDPAKRLIAQATQGDYYYFDNIKVRCPGDKVSRQLPSIVFKIR